jgi:hypothetical protein
MQHFLFGTDFDTTYTYRWPLWRPYAALMQRRSITHPCPSGIVQRATACWKTSKPKSQYFYGHSYTCPTPREYILQQLGLAISNATAIHLRDAKQGNLTATEPSNTPDDDHEGHEEDSWPHNATHIGAFPPTMARSPAEELSSDFAAIAFPASTISTTSRFQENCSILDRVTTQYVANM